MISEESRKSFAQTVRFGNALLLIPFKWDSGLERLVESRLRLHVIFMITSCIGYSGLLSWYMFVCIPTSASDTIFMIFVDISSVTLLAIMGWLCWKHDLLLFTCNSVFELHLKHRKCRCYHL